MGRKRVLLAEDDEELSGLLEFYLRKQDCDVTAVQDGKAALTKGRDERFDLIVMDVMMPGLDGYHVAQQLSQALGPACPRILIMTSRDIGKEAGLAMLSGAATTLQKPFKLAEFKAKLAELLADPTIAPGEDDD